MSRAPSRLSNLGPGPLRVRRIGAWVMLLLAGLLLTLRLLGAWTPTWWALALFPPLFLGLLNARQAQAST